MAQGWISIHRQLQSHWLWEDKPFSRGQAWIDLLLLANHADNKFLFGNELIEVKAGSFITSERKLGERWGWSRKKVDNFLKLLEKDNMIVLEKNHQRTAINIVNYSDFQDCDIKKEPPKNHKKTTKEPQKNTNNNDNNDNNENKIIYNADPALNQAIIQFVEFRKSIKKPMSEHAVELMIKKLQKMTPDVGKQIEIINQSILNGWQGIFPLKEEPQPKQQKKSGRKEPVPDWMKKKNGFNNFEQRDYNMNDLEGKLLEANEKTQQKELSPEYKKRVEALKKELGAS